MIPRKLSTIGISRFWNVFDAAAFCWPYGACIPSHHAVRPTRFLRRAWPAEYVEVGVFREIAEPESPSSLMRGRNQQGKPGHETLVTVTFAEHGGKTKLTFHQAVFDSVTSRDAHAECWSSAFERLTEYLAKL